jgi:enoyl-CoA hydratase/carnithine racemase
MNTATTVPDAVAGITRRHEGALAVVEIGLPQAKNSFRTENARALAAGLDAAVADGARAVLLRSVGPVFSAGWDITSINPAVDDPMAMIGEVVGPLCRQLRTLPVPTVAAIAGPALGFGFGLALCCDIVLAADDALLGSPFRQLGMVPDTGAHHILLSRVGFSLASELIYTGRLVSGREAAELRLVNRALPAEQLHEQAMQLAQGIANGPTQAFALSKEVLLQGGDFDAMLAHEARQLKRVFATADLKEGIAAFQQRRKPVFVGR